MLNIIDFRDYKGPFSYPYEFFNNFTKLMDERDYHSGLLDADPTKDFLFDKYHANTLNIEAEHRKVINGRVVFK